MLHTEARDLPVETDSNESPKSKRGGKRPGAGRKPNLAKRLLKGIHRDTILAAVQEIDVGGVIQSLLKSKREVIRLQTLSFIFDRVQGKPKQDIGIPGGNAARPCPRSAPRFRAQRSFGSARARIRRGAR